MSISKRCLVNIALLLLLVAGLHVSMLAQDEPPGRDSTTSKSPFLGFLLSATATGVPLGCGIALDGSENEDAGMWLALGGIVVGPATGFLYGGESGRGLLGIGIRVGLIGGSVLMMSARASNARTLGEALDGIVVIGVIGLAAVGVSALYDIFTVGSSISEKNAMQKVFGISVSPTYGPNKRSMGIRLTLGL